MLVGLAPQSPRLSRASEMSLRRADRAAPPGANEFCWCFRFSIERSGVALELSRGARAVS